MNVSTTTLTALAVAAVLLTITLPLAGRVARQDGPAVGRVVRWGLVVKLLGVPLQLYVTARFYNNVADFNRYHGLGRDLAADFPAGLFDPEGGRVVGVRFIGMVTGTLYWIIGVNKPAGFLVFSWLCFLGQFLFYRAFRTALPDADPLRYAKLLFFLPSMVYWPSTIGKDAWMCMALGIAALGCAMVLTRRRGGFAIALAGMVAGAVVRPHVMLLLFVGVAVAYLLRKAPDGSSATGSKIGGVIVLVVSGILLLGSVEKFFGVERTDAASIDQVLDSTSKNSRGRVVEGEEGVDPGFGSSFDPTGLRSPLRFPEAVATVLFRPWPFEADNIPSLAASLEGTFLAALFVICRRRVFAAFRSLRRRPYVIVVVLYSVIFVYFFAAIGNFGILAREKVQVLPFLLVLLAFAHPIRTTYPPPTGDTLRTPSTTRSSS